MTQSQQNQINQSDEEIIRAYIEMRNTGSYNVAWFYRYYILNSGDTIDIATFASIFNMANLSSILEHIDTKFKLTRLYDKNNNFIKIIEK